ncbi:MAG TPA: hypothetical protein ENK85_02535 [Saprospiraceae bacterium]|nr:hypothetical protein [Saprospiraceae bacterium]
MMTSATPNWGGEILKNNLMNNIVLLTLISLLFLSCNSCDTITSPRCERDFAFSIPVSLSPALDTFSIGDTIAIELEFPIQMIDEITSDTIDMTTYPFATTINFARLDTILASSANTLVEFVVTQGELEFIPLFGGINITHITYETINSNFVFSCKVVLKSKGLFEFGSGSIKPYHDIYQEIQPSCKTKSVEMKYELLPSGGDDNFDFLAFSPDPQKKNYPNDKFIANSGFVFFVTD